MYWIHGFLFMLLQLSFIEAQPTRANHGIQDNVAHKGFNAKNILKYLPPHLVKELQQSSKSHNPIAIFTAGDFSMDSPDDDYKDEIYERNGPIPHAGSEENSLKYDESNEIYYDDDRNDEPDMDADYSTSSNEMSELRRVRRNSDALVHTRPVRTLALLNTVSNVARSATEGHINDKTLEIMYKLSRALQTYLATINKDEGVTLDIKKKIELKTQHKNKPRKDSNDSDKDSTNNEHTRGKREELRNSDVLVHSRPVRTLALLNTVSKVAGLAHERHSHHDKTLKIIANLSGALRTSLSHITEHVGFSLDVNNEHRNKPQEGSNKSHKDRPSKEQKNKEHD